MMDRIEQQLDLFATTNGTYKIKKPVRLIELFSGIGSQAKSLEILKVPFEHWKTCEWAYNSIIAYNAIHLKDKTDYSKDLTKQELIDYLQGNISTDYNEPCDVSKKNEQWLRTCYNSCIATHNLMNIMKVKGVDLQITETDKYEYIMTYSFPCQDLSLAGLGKGMSVSQAEGGTRSGLLWEVERILKELIEKPQILLMENVPEVVGSNNINDFKKWEYTLRQLGYKNYVEILNAKDYGIPQNRRRCYMVSILNSELDYEFPSKMPLKYRLKDFLEHSVDEKYYLSDKMIQYISATGTENFHNADSKINLEVARPLTTNNNKRAGTTNYLSDDLPENADLKQIGQLYNKSSNPQAGRIYDSNGLCPTMDTMEGGNRQPKIAEGVLKIKNATKKGYEVAQEGDGVDISSRMETHRGTVQKGIIQTIKANIDVGVVVKNEK